MSFTITVRGSAGSGMESNGAAEIDAVRQVMRTIRSTMQDQGLETHSVTVQPAEWQELQLA